MCFYLYFFADAFFEVAGEDEGKGDCVEHQIEHPRRGEAEHHGVKGGALRIDELHPRYAENEGECDVGGGGKKRIAEGLECVGKHAVCRLDGGEEGDEEEALHSVVYGDGRG